MSAMCRNRYVAFANSLPVSGSSQTTNKNQNLSAGNGKGTYSLLVIHRFFNTTGKLPAQKNLFNLLIHLYGYVTRLPNFFQKLIQSSRLLWHVIKLSDIFKNIT